MVEAPHLALQIRHLRFWGASDDLFEIEGTKGKEPDEVGCFNSMVAVKVCNDLAGLIVVGFYAALDQAPKGMPGCWTVGICPLDEDIPLPDWPMRWSLGGRGYSTMLEMDVPGDVRVTLIEGPEDGR